MVISSFKKTEKKNNFIHHNIKSFMYFCDQILKIIKKL